MSATIPVNLYKQLYGDRVKVIDISNIKHMGVINQYTKRSFSQGGMKDYSTKIYEEVLDIINKVKDKIKDDPRSLRGQLGEFQGQGEGPRVSGIRRAAGVLYFRVVAVRPGAPADYLISFNTIFAAVFPEPSTAD